MNDEEALLAAAARAAAGPVPVVLLHAAGMMPTMWQSQVEALGAERRAFAPWIKGFRPGATNKSSIREASDEIITILDQQGVYAAAIVAHQLGALVALQCALDHPDRIDRVVLSGVSLLPGKKMLAVQRRMIKMMPASQFDGHKEDLLHALDAMADADFSERLAQIQAPALIICGEQDDQNQQNANAVAAQMPNATLTLVPGEGPDPMFDSPPEYNAAMASFLED